MANCLFTFARNKGGLQVKLLLGTLFTSVWGKREINLFIRIKT